MNRLYSLLATTSFMLVVVLHSPTFGQEDYSTWAHSCRLLLNTSSTGANVGNDVDSFAVLVRLNPTTFKYFSQTADSGKDIRFSEADGTSPLDYNIERWVDVAGDNDTADIWVSVPTVNGNNFSQSIVMYWGNTEAADSSDGTKVFSLANGHEAVWHLSDDPVNGSPSIRNEFSGSLATPYGNMSINDRRAGAIGYCFAFGNPSNYIVTTQSTSAGERSLSAWIYPTASDTTTHMETIIDGDIPNEYGNGFGLADTGIRVLLDDEFWTTSQRVTLNEWQHVLMSYKDNSATLYYNGIQVASTSYTMADRSDTVYHIGRSSANPTMFFHGRIDEVRVDDDFKSADWAKLCYESQKPDQSLIPVAPDLTWDTASTSGTQIGNGTWGTDSYWTFNDTQLVPWLGQGHSATFVGSTGSYTITVSGRQVVDSIAVLSGIELLFSGGTIDFDSRSGITITDGTTAVGSIIDGSSGLTKYGSGTLTLSGDNIYTGATNVTAGSLRVNGSVASTGAVTITTGAILGGSGTIAGAVTASGATVVPGDGGPGKLTLGALTLGSSSQVTFELGSSADTIAVTGALALDGTIDITPVAGFDAGTYRLFTCSSLTGSLTVGTGVPAGRTYTFDEGDDYLDVEIATDLLQSEPADTTLVSGQELTLAVAAEGEGSLTYRWQRSPDTTSIGSSATLTISALDNSYNGAEYRCIVTDSFGSDTSRWVVINVLNTPQIIDQSTDTTIFEGDDVTFSITLLTTAQVQYQWLKVDSSTTLSDSTSLVLEAVTADDAGKYVCIVSNTVGSVTSDTIELTVQAPPPVARFDYTPTSGTVPLTVTFHDSSRGVIDSREWDFGDGATDTAKNTTHVYTVTGEYAVLLTVSGPNGTDVSDTAYVYAGDSIPVARFDYDPTSGSAPLDVSFTDMSTGIITSRTWLFGDGKSDTTKNPVHSYSENGTYPVLLAVEGPGGTDTTDTAYVTVTTPLLLTANFGYTPNNGAFPLEVTFTDSSSGTITSRLWNFGDGVSSTEQNPKHIYTEAGTYSVTLTVTGPEGTDSLMRTDAISVTTGIVDDSLQSALKLTSLVFDSAAVAIRVSWCIDSARFSDGLEVGVAYHPGEPPNSMDGSQIITVISPCTDDVVELGESVVFDTVYYVALFARKPGSPWPAPTSRARGSVPIGAPYRQDVTFNETDVTTDTIRVFNDRIRVWEDPGYSTLVLTDTIEVYDYTAPEGFTVVGSPIVFRDEGLTVPFYIGIRITENLPGQTSISDVRIYHADSGVITVEHGSAVDSVSGFVYVRTDDRSLPFIAMIDTESPHTAFTRKPDSVAYAKNDLTDSVAISDNIANVHWTYLYSRGDAHPTPRDSGTLTDTFAQKSLTISSSSQVISSEYGVRALLVVSDGVYRDTLDLSRSVHRDNSDEFITTAGTWHPIYPTARLYETNPDSTIIIQAGKNGEYDTRYIRLFRWIELSGNENEKWVEYDPDASMVQSLFSVTPGKLFWLKTRKNTLVHLGAGRTISSKDTVRIELSPDEYTDFGLPFRFDIRLNDIFAASPNATDSVHVYLWKRDSSTNQYYLERLYINSMADKNDPNTILGYRKHSGGYSLFNPYKRAVVLHIPSTLAPADSLLLSKRARKASEKTSWGTKLLVTTSKGTNHPAVYCGYTPGLKRSRFPVTPTFLPLRVFLYDRSTGIQSGHSVDEDAAGGLTKEVRIVNSSDSAMYLSYRFETTGSFPETYQTGLYDGTTGHLTSNGSISLQPHSTASRWIVAGDNQYFTRFKNRAATITYGFGRIYPNPARSTVKFRFTIGFGTQEKVRLTIFDLQGRKVWEKEIRSQLALSEHMITWNGIDRNRSPVGAGRYPVRLSFIDESGKVTRQYDQVLTFIP